MLLYNGEPQASFETMPQREFANLVRERFTKPVTVIGVDGRSGGGKTTLALNLATQLGATLLSTDDFAWWHSLFDWPEMLIENGLKPLAAGNDIAFNPPAWTERGRAGAIVAQANPVIVVEGVGATQASMRPHLDLCVWVQSDAIAAKERGLIRDAAERPDPAEAERFWNEWQAAENDFQAQQQSWLSAQFTVCGTPESLPNFATHDFQDSKPQDQIWLAR
ncbi:MAG: uridine kinase [Micrococcales bacterium]